MATNNKLLQELRRRKDAGRLGIIRPEKPADFEKWPLDKRITWAIDWLEDIQPPPNVESDNRAEITPQYKLLVSFGEAAVPALIDSLEKDERLTRWVGIGGGEGSMHWGHMSVTGVVGWALDEILNFSHTGNVRDYWREFGKLPQVERLMRHLTDVRNDPMMRDEAASRLAHFGDIPGRVTKLAEPFVRINKKGLHPDLQNFRNPTVAEAILALMDERLAKPRDREANEDSYLMMLADLQDPRISIELEKRYRKSTNSFLRAKLAYVMHRLGASNPLREFATEFKKGTMDLFNLPEGGQGEDKGETMLRIISWLSQCRAPIADEALLALAENDHPLHETTVKYAFGSRFYESEKFKFGNPFCFAFLRQDLDDMAASGSTYEIMGKRLDSHHPGIHVRGSIPPYLSDPAQRKESTMGRVCDEAATKLTNLIHGLPEFHPLMKDADERIASLRTLLDNHRKQLRLLDQTERDALGISWVQKPCYIIDMLPLGRTALAEDVAQKRAIFHLDGKGKVADVKLPASAIHKKDKVEESPYREMVVQAEIDEQGRMILGIIGEHEMRAVPADDLTDIRPIGDK